MFVSKPTDIAAQAKRLAQKGPTPEQLERRRIVDERNKRLQEAPIKRGPNAHPDGTFGKTKP
jgi:hypothetical protein